MPIGIKESEALTQFEGKIVGHEKKAGEFGEQYIQELKPADPTLIKNGKTGSFWNYLRVPPTATDDELPKDSVLQKFVEAVCKADKDLKKCNTVHELFSAMDKKSYLFSKMKLGKSFENHDARDVWVPVALR